MDLDVQGKAAIVTGAAHGIGRAICVELGKRGANILAYGPEAQKALVDSIALKWLGKAEDIANGVLCFASDLANWITGQSISSDGGKTII